MLSYRDMLDEAAQELADKSYEHMVEVFEEVFAEELKGATHFPEEEFFLGLADLAVGVANCHLDAIANAAVKGIAHIGEDPVIRDLTSKQIYGKKWAK